ncbi:MAG: EamA family transporter [Gammaproteobacteria bacterium AqS3]|nr:EamA family transporter [Gammaproteobacteria bacterium AqS3]
MGTLPSSLMVMFLGAIWGSSFFLISVALTEFEPLQVGAMRIVITGLTLLIFLRSALPNINGRMLLLTVVGLSGMGVPFLLFPIAQTQITSALAGMINAMVPAFTYILSILLFRQRSQTLPWCGIGVSMLGIWLLLIPPGAPLTSLFDISQVWAPLLCVLACTMYAVAMNMTRFRLGGMAPEHIACLSTLPLLAIYVPYLLAINPPLPAGGGFSSGWWLALGAVGVLGLVNTAMSAVLFNRLILKTSPLIASLTTYVAPIVAVGLGALIGEIITLQQLIGLMLVLSGIFAVSAAGILRAQRLRRLQHLRAERVMTGQ